MERVRYGLRELFNGLWFVPTVVACLVGGLGFLLVQIDEATAWRNSPWVFGGSASAARTVLTTIAGSLITVAGLTFSVTMIVLQLASSQFSPRVLRNFLRDRFTQATVGVFIGIFIYCLIGLRSVGGVANFVPRLTVTIASMLGVLAVILLIVFIHHISVLIQVSEVSARIARETTAALDRVYPQPYGEGADESGAELVGEWRAVEPRRIAPAGSGYVRRIDVAAVAAAVRGRAVRIHILVAPGDFVSAESGVVDVWPPDADVDEERIRNNLVVGNERDIDQDVSFGVRQLTDIALRAISPGINDPTTAVTCIGYIGAFLERLAARALPARVRRLDDGRAVVVARRVDYEEYVESLAEIGRYASGDARLVRQLLRTCAAVREAAERAGARGLVSVVDEIAEAIGEQGLEQARGARERALITELR
jgi:uncharacterized membrane protein